MSLGDYLDHFRFTIDDMHCTSLAYALILCWTTAYTSAAPTITAHISAPTSDVELGLASHSSRHSENLDTVQRIKQLMVAGDAYNNPNNTAVFSQKLLQAISIDHNQDTLNKLESLTRALHAERAEYQLELDLTPENALKHQAQREAVDPQELADTLKFIRRLRNDAKEQPNGVAHRALHGITLARKKRIQRDLALTNIELNVVDAIIAATKYHRQAEQLNFEESRYGLSNAEWAIYQEEYKPTRTYSAMMF